MNVRELKERLNLLKDDTNIDIEIRRKEDDFKHLYLYDIENISIRNSNIASLECKLNHYMTRDILTFYENLVEQIYNIEMEDICRKK